MYFGTTNKFSRVVVEKYLWPRSCSRSSHCWPRAASVRLRPVRGPAAGGSASGESTAMQEPEVKIPWVSTGRTGNFRKLIYSTEEEQCTDAYIERVKHRTNGRLKFQISSVPVLGLAVPDSLRLIVEFTMELAEIYSGDIGGDPQIIGVANFWGLHQNSTNNFAAIDAACEGIHRIIEKQSNGIVMTEIQYESNYYFYSRALNALEDFEG